MKRLKVVILVVTWACILCLIMGGFPSLYSTLVEQRFLKSDLVLPPLSMFPRVDTINNLSSQDMASIKTFVLFVGSGRSGHSIVGSLMDAHPHVVISHEYHIFRNWSKIYDIHNQNWTQTLINSLYRKSVDDTSGIRNSSSKGYTLRVDNLWQGRFDQYIEVIGDKSGGSTTTEYLKNKKLFQMRLEILKRDLSIPIRIIHVVRNPYDHIATRSLYDHVDISLVSSLKQILMPHNGIPSFKMCSDHIMEKNLHLLFAHYRAAVELIELFGRKNVLEVHISDLIKDPKATLARIFEFVEVYAPEDFLDVCAGKVYNSASRTRELITWPPQIKQMVEEQMKNYGFLTRYSFTSD